MVLQRTCSLSIQRIANSLYSRAILQPNYSHPINAEQLQEIIIASGDTVTIHGDSLSGFDGAAIGTCVHVSGKLRSDERLCVMAHVWTHVLRSRLNGSPTSARYYHDACSNSYDVEVQIARAFERKFLTQPVHYSLSADCGLKLIGA